MNNGVMEGDESAKGMARKTVYLDSEVLRKGEKRAKADGRSFSNYLVQLIRRDVGEAPGNLEPVKEGSAA